MSYFPDGIKDRLFEIDGELHLTNKTRTRTKCGKKFPTDAVPLVDIRYSVRVCPTCYLYIEHEHMVVGTPSNMGDLITDLEKSETKVSELQAENQKMSELIKKAAPRYIKARKAQRQEERSKDKKRTQV